MRLELLDMEEKDLPLVLEMEQICFKDPWTIEALNYEFHENPYSRQIVLKSIDDEMNETLIGFCIYWITFDSATICQIAIHPSYRRKHLGSSLLKEMLDDCFARRAEFVTLEVRKNNESAIEFYKHNGFEVVTIKPHYYNDGEDAYYMLRKVDITL